MTRVRDFEDLEIWKMARDLVNDIYSDFRHCKDFVFRNQITDAGLSTQNNIAEGFGRDSDKEFLYFLNVSKGSAAEVKSMYYIAEDRNYVTSEIAAKRRNKAQRLMNGIGLLRSYLLKCVKSK
ncbi:MAG: four helix bundle protein [Bacteroidales bacterium]|nr:four helix bundle protein [Bacteroidales bacterium]